MQSSDWLLQKLGVAKQLPRKQSLGVGNEIKHV